MTDRVALLKAVHADPVNPLPKLVFADWLDDHGDDGDRLWAEFIRLDHAIRESPTNPPDRLRRRDELIDLRPATIPVPRPIGRGLPTTRDFRCVTP